MAAVSEEEFALEPHAAYNNLRIYPERGFLERHCGLLCDLAEGVVGSKQLLVFGSPFVEQSCAKSYEKVMDGSAAASAAAAADGPFAVYLRSGAAAAAGEALAAFAAAAAASSAFAAAYVLCPASVASALPHPYKCLLQEINCDVARPTQSMVLCIPAERKQAFDTGFSFYFNGAGEFAYDNLIHLCIMVKNAGPLFEQVLTENLSIIDRWTVLDTGSTDGTQDIVRRVLKGKKGTLIEEPFLNFRDSRNRCLELAGDVCKYTLMLDDTYAIRGDLRKFLNLIRGDTFANSYSLLIQSDDSEYYSNRLVKTADKLRYLYTIHEVIQAEGNVTVVIPKEEAWICDHRAPYMEARTKDRKQYDLKCLFEMLEEEPANPRHLYYLAQTYSCIEDYEKAAHWFQQRALATGGHHQEAVDSMFELARLYNFKLGKPWALCEETYKKAYAMDPTRPDALYFLGIHYYLDSEGGGEGKGEEEDKAKRRGTNRRIAYEYFKQGFALGYPVHAQFSLKPTLTYHFLPKFLTQLCYEQGDWSLGLAASELFLSHAKPTDDSYSLIGGWHAIFKGLVGMGPIAAVARREGSKPLLVIVADGGWGPWTGRDLVEKGVGGSETWVIETARWIQREGTYRVVVFCRCDGVAGEFDGVLYRPLEEFGRFAATTRIQTCIVSRYSEYVPVALAGHVDNVYFILHDIGPTGNIIPLSPRLRKIWCLTEWHREFFVKNFPTCADRTEVLGYGVDLERFGLGENQSEGQAKQPFSFLYSSFPNRGLLPLLHLWPRIRAEWPEAVLDVYSDIEGEWVNRVAGEEMTAIRQLLSAGMEGVRMHGWVSKAELANAWKRAEVWLYPCVFAETFCLTALEAQAAGVVVVCPPLAALRDTVGNRGLLIGTGQDGEEARTEEWAKAALQALRGVLGEEGRQKKEALVTAGKAWAQGRSWESVTKRVVQDVFAPTIGKELDATSHIIQHFYASILEITNRLVDICAQSTHVLEVGPGQHPFPKATHFVDMGTIATTVAPSNILRMDIDTDVFAYENKHFEFTYCRHVLEDIQNPDHAFRELVRVSRAGYIETPSPLIEVLRGVDGGVDGGGAATWRGYHHHRYIIWTDRENVLNFLPKYPILETLVFSEEFERKLITLANRGAVYWNNYFIWDSSELPRYRIHKHGITFDIQRDYARLLEDAIQCSVEHTGRFMKKLGLQALL
jgi:glycosyltransferase involved in cell wall biosynthesis